MSLDLRGARVLLTGRPAASATHRPRLTPKALLVLTGRRAERSTRYPPNWRDDAHRRPRPSEAPDELARTSGQGRRARREPACPASPLTISASRPRPQPRGQPAHADVMARAVVPAMLERGSGHLVFIAPSAVSPPHQAVRSTAQRSSACAGSPTACARTARQAAWRLDVMPGLVRTQACSSESGMQLPPGVRTTTPGRSPRESSRDTARRPVRSSPHRWRSGSPQSSGHWPQHSRQSPANAAPPRSVPHRGTP